jgi:hypothetical protein
MPSDPTWYTPVCDDVLRKIFMWHSRYNSGDPSATRPFVELNGRVVDKVTRVANRIRFKPNELDHLIRILDALTPTRELVDFYRKIRQNIKSRGHLVAGGEYEVIIDAYLQDAEETLKTLVRAKTGKLKTIDELVKERTEQGKMPFEV